MKAVRHIKTMALVSVFAAAAWVVAAPGAPAYAQGSEEDTPTAAEGLEITTVETPAPEAQTTGEAATDVVYSYVAQPGDSYTKMARKAMQTYGLKFSVAVSEARIVYAETNMTIEAGSPMLEVGQNVTFKESDLKAWAEKALALDADAEARWNYYVPFVDFNTDRVGQSA